MKEKLDPLKRQLNFTELKPGSKLPPDDPKDCAPNHISEKKMRLIMKGVAKTIEKLGTELDRTLRNR